MHMGPNIKIGLIIGLIFVSSPWLLAIEFNRHPGPRPQGANNTGGTRLGWSVLYIYIATTRWSLGRCRG